VYRGPSGWIVIFSTQRQLDSLWEAMGRLDLSTDPRFVNNDARVRHRDDLTRLIEEWMAGFPSDADVIAALEEHRVPCSRVNDPALLVDDEHLRARDAIRIVPDPRLGSVATPGFPIHFAGTTPPRRLGADEVVAPNLGQHNREVLSGLLGVDEAAIADLEQRGILASKDR
jgi:crotonobetainyl-CoA:carnitine CoA-transferase CaiB-like acyl-CoA transferase